MSCRSNSQSASSAFIYRRSSLLAEDGSISSLSSPGFLLVDDSSSYDDDDDTESNSSNGSTCLHLPSLEDDDDTSSSVTTSSISNGAAVLQPETGQTQHQIQPKRRSTDWRWESDPTSPQHPHTMDAPIIPPRRWSSKSSQQQQHQQRRRFREQENTRSHHCCESTSSTQGRPCMAASRLSAILLQRPRKPRRQLSSASNKLLKESADTETYAKAKYLDTSETKTDNTEPLTNYPEADTTAATNNKNKDIKDYEVSQKQKAEETNRKKDEKRPFVPGMASQAQPYSSKQFSERLRRFPLDLPTPQPRPLPANGPRYARRFGRPVIPLRRGRSLQKEYSI